MVHWAVAALVSVAIGVVLGLLGGGGGVLAVPLLVYGIGVGTKSAIATSLFFIAVTSALGAALAAREGRVRWKTGALFGAGSACGAFVGGKLAQRVPEDLLIGGLALLMLATALAMMRGRTPHAPRSATVRLTHMVAIGGSVGLLSGLVGAGGGFLIVPALTLFGGLAIREAIGTSLLIISFQSFSGFAGHLGHVQLSTPLIGVMAVPAIGGMVAGSSLGRRVTSERLRQGFAWLILATALFMLGRELPLVWSATSIGFALAAVVFVKRRGAARSSVGPKGTECTTSLRSQP